MSSNVTVFIGSPAAAIAFSGPSSRCVTENTIKIITASIRLMENAIAHEVSHRQRYNNQAVVIEKPD